jgi:predicted DNA-binding transcriptional regulator AlpA
MKDRLINEKEAALILGCSIHKMQKDRRVGSPIPFIKVGRSVRYKRRDIEAYLEQQYFTSTSEYGGGNHE